MPLTRRGAVFATAGALGAAGLLGYEGERFRRFVEAYIYGYPLVTMELTRRVMTNVAQVGPARAPMGQFVKARTYPDATYKDAPAPNADTLYTSAWLDVGEQPWILSLPEMKDRYFLFPMLDGWSNVFEDPGTRTTGDGAQTHAIVGPGWRGDLPAGATSYRSPTSLVWILGRIYCSGTPQDYGAVHRLQDACKLAPLSAYRGAPMPTPAPPDTRVDMHTGLRDQVNRLDAATFFTLLAALMQRNPPPAADAPMIAKLAEIGVVPGRPLDQRRFREPFLGLVPKVGFGEIMAHFKLSGGDVQNRNGWGWTLKAGAYGQNYIMRALIAAIGLGANLPQDAVYAIAAADQRGRALNGAHRYVIHVPPGREPPARGFWSITLYGPDFYFVDNPIKRSAISPRNQLARNADGSIDIHVQHTPPEPAAMSNWLPAPEGPFQLMLRMYWPNPQPPSILDGSWSIPPVQQI